ncbi:hypothetical protein B0H11DRAFT_301207 [Mycena galericulata]|nr:hypothetical protein B0H11DRAFT_301207 [Mycena galericulata]
MDFFKRSHSCRLALKLLYGNQKRNFMGNASWFSWKSPIFYSPISRNGSLKLPPAVTTLDPRRFGRSNYFDISQSSLKAQFRKIRTKQIPDAHSRQYGNHIATANTNFPPGTCGFLYFHSPAYQSPLGGGAIRFRVTKNSDPGSFLTGHDLLMTHGLPWQIPVWELLTLRIYQHLANLLTSDGFAPRELKLACESLNIERDTVLIPAIGQPVGR